MVTAALPPLRQMNEYSTWSNNPAFTMGYYEYQTLPESQLAMEFTLCDHMFQGAYGASCLNHLYMIGGRDPGSMPVFATVGQVSVITDNPATLLDNIVSPAPEYFMVNSADPTNPPHGLPAPSTGYVPVLTYDTIGDRLNDAGVSWKWYSENWDATIAAPTGPIASSFDFDHQPFNFFQNYAPGTAARAAHLQDMSHYFSDIQNHTLPAVVYLKPYATHDEHPNDGILTDGQNFAMNLVNTLRNSDYWKDSLVIITYDESGGWWDHVAPPREGDGHTLPGQSDQFGPGARIPMILAGPFARRHYVSSEQLDTTSLLKLIESRYHLKPLAVRDAAANNVAMALDVDPVPDFDQDQAALQSALSEAQSGLASLQTGKGPMDAAQQTLKTDEQALVAALQGGQTENVDDLIDKVGQDRAAAAAAAVPPTPIPTAEPTRTIHEPAPSGGTNGVGGGQTKGKKK